MWDLASGEPMHASALHAIFGFNLKTSAVLDGIQQGRPKIRFRGRVWRGTV
jgi:hypothetical protein